VPLSPDDVGKLLPSVEFEWSERDVILYALAIGASADDLAHIYEGAILVTLPTFGVILSFKGFSALGEVLDFDHSMTLHGTQRLELIQPIPTSGRTVTIGHVAHVWDKGSAAVLVAQLETRLEDGTLICVNEASAFVRGAGGFGGERGPSSSVLATPTREPDHVVRTQTRPDQAALYRLMGDSNPLHVDPAVAKAANLPKPILHGLCTFGIVGRVAMETFALNDVSVGAIEARFAGVLFPGETIETSFWEEDDNIVFRSASVERESAVLEGGLVKKTKGK
jgi:acyl dehydratase